MRTLSLAECSFINGGNDIALPLMLITGTLGGLAGYQVASFAGPVWTFFGTIGTGGIGTIICLPAFPVGPVLCGAAGLGVGYLVSSTIANISGFAVGAAMAALVTYKVF